MTVKELAKTEKFSGLKKISIGIAVSFHSNTENRYLRVTLSSGVHAKLGSPSYMSGMVRDGNVHFYAEDFQTSGTAPISLLPKGTQVAFQLNEVKSPLRLPRMGGCNIEWVAAYLDPKGGCIICADSPESLNEFIRDKAAAKRAAKLEQEARDKTALEEHKREESEKIVHIHKNIEEAGNVAEFLRNLSINDLSIRERDAVEALINKFVYVIEQDGFTDINLTRDETTGKFKFTAQLG